MDGDMCGVERLEDRVCMRDHVGRRLDLDEDPIGEARLHEEG